MIHCISSDLHIDKHPYEFTFGFCIKYRHANIVEITYNRVIYVGPVSCRFKTEQDFALWYMR